MSALTWHGENDDHVDTVPDTQIMNPRDAIDRITSIAIYGSDLHLYDHVIPRMKSGGVLGHEVLGELVEVGSANKTLRAGDKVHQNFVISCVSCLLCQKQPFAACDFSNS